VKDKLPADSIQALDQRDLVVKSCEYGKLGSASFSADTSLHMQLFFFFFFRKANFLMQHEFGQQLKQQLIFSNANNCPCFSQLNLPNIAKPSTISTYHEVRDINTSFRAKSLVLMGRNQSQGC
jgi:hypothetical protein